MKVIVYRVEVADSALDFLHGNMRRILEVLIPEKEIAFNLGSTGVQLFVHRPTTQDAGRYDTAERVRDVDVSPTLVAQLEVYLGLQETITAAVSRSGLLKM